MSKTGKSATFERVLPFVEARHLVEAEAARLLETRKAQVESADLLAARGRVLAEEVRADRDLPPFRRATRDGFAVFAADLATASQAFPVSLDVISEIAAGARELPRLQSGEAAAIMTGAPVPEAADAVVMVEHTRSSSRGQVEILRAVVHGENIVPRGAEARAGAALLACGSRLDAAALAVAASSGKAQVQVFQRPRVAVLSTGDELVEITAAPGPHQIRNSNTYSLAAQIGAAGGEAVLLPIAPDETSRLAELISDGLGADLLLLSGGVSMGKYDFVEQALAQFHAEFFFTGALIQPGRPVVFGRALSGDGSSKYFLGLPGNPVSTLVTFALFAAPIISALSGARPQPLRFLQARLKAEIRTRTGLTRFFPARLSNEQEKTEVERIPWQGSGDVVATAQANCYIVVPPDRASLEAGEMVHVLPA